MSHKKIAKTNAMRILDRHKVDYEATAFEPDPDHLDAVTAAENLGVKPEEVYKTLVLVGSDKQHYVAVIPGPSTLDLKAVAEAFSIKSCQMLPARELKSVTGYIHGGCSPVGMKKQFPTLIDAAAEGLEKFYVSAGEIGKQLHMSPRELVDFLGGSFVNLTGLT